MLTRASIATYTQSATATVPPAPAVAGPASTFVFRPSGSSSGSGVYGTWPTLMLAVNQVPGQRFITYDDTFGPCEIPAGAWSVDNCVISTVPTAGSGRLFIADGAVLVFNRLDFVDADIEVLATSPVVTLSAGITCALRLDASILNCLAAGPFLRVTSTAGRPAVLLENLSAIGDGTHTVFQVDAGANLDFNSLTGSALGNHATAGAGTVNFTHDDTSSPFSSPQAATFNTIPLSDPHNMPYTPTTPANWSNVSPRTLQAALDRIAAHVGPIP